MNGALLLQIDVQLFGEYMQSTDKQTYIYMMIMTDISFDCVQMSLAWTVTRSVKSFLPRSMS